MQDVILAVRRLRAAPWFALAAMLTLGIGIGLNTIAFTTVNALTLRLIPVPEAARLARVLPLDSKGRRQNQVSYLDYLDYRQHTSTVDGLVGYALFPMSVRMRTADGRESEPEHVTGYYVSGNFFSVLGITPTLGRTIVAADEQAPGTGAVAVISHTLWTRALDSDPRVIGRTLTVNGDVVTIVGVGPREFMGTEPIAPDVWLPLTMRKQARAGDPDFYQRNTPWVFMIGRLPQGVTAVDAVEREMTTIARGLAQTWPTPIRPMTVTLKPATFFSINPVVGQVITLVMAILGMVLLVACANVGNLVLARAVTRQREVALRLALGASRYRLIRQLLTECLLLAAGGAAVGMLLSYWTLLILRSIGMTLLPFRWTTVIIDITPDLHVFAYTGLVAAFTGVIFGLAPALQAARLDLVAGLRDEATALGLRWRQSRLRDALVVVQIAVCLMLLVAAGLLTRALARAQGLDVGFETHGVVSVDADLTQAAVPAKAVAEFVQRLADRARQLPGVRSVSLTTHVPLLTAANFTELRLEGQAAGTQPGEETLGSQYLSVTPEYFDTLKLAIVRGRRFSAADSESASAVVISEALARRFWPGQDPIGRPITTALSPYPRTVVGVVRDASDVSIFRGQEISMYFPMPADLTQAQPSVHLMARVDGDPRAVIDVLRKEARDIDPRAVVEIFTLDDALSLFTLPSRAAAIGAAVLGAIALILALIGVYSVLAYVVTQRRAEIAIRMAMGASASQVARLILTQGLTLVGIGMTIGLIGALTTSRALRVALLGLSPADPATFIGVAALLLTIAAIACYVPARRASRVDPMVALRIQ